MKDYYNYMKDSTGQQTTVCASSACKREKRKKYVTRYIEECQKYTSDAKIHVIVQFLTRNICQ